MSTPVQQSADTPSSKESASQNVDYEKRYKDTQSAFSKGQQEIARLRAENEVLKNSVVPVVNIDEATQQKLEDLKFSNPDAWRTELNKIEQDAQHKHQAVLSEAAKAAETQSEIKRRQSLLDSYNSSHPDRPITDEVISLDVPTRITKKLEKGEVSFEEFLEEVHNYIYKPKTIGDGNSVTKDPNLSKIGGGHESQDSGNGQLNIVENYNQIIF